MIQPLQPWNEGFQGQCAAHLAWRPLPRLDFWNMACSADCVLFVTATSLDSFHCCWWFVGLLLFVFHYLFALLSFLVVLFGLSTFVSVNFCLFLLIYFYLAMFFGLMLLFAAYFLRVRLFLLVFFRLWFVAFPLISRLLFIHSCPVTWCVSIVLLSPSGWCVFVCGCVCLCMSMSLSLFLFLWDAQGSTSLPGR